MYLWLFYIYLKYIIYGNDSVVLTNWNCEQENPPYHHRAYQTLNELTVAAAAVRQAYPKWIGFLRILLAVKSQGSLNNFV